MSSKLSQKNNIYAEPHPDTLPIVQEREHLEIVEGVLLCQECSSHITIDRSYPHIEFGHRRKLRCSHRPDELRR